MLKAEGGSLPLTWLVDGALVNPLPHQPEAHRLRCSFAPDGDLDPGADLADVDPRVAVKGQNAGNPLQYALFDAGVRAAGRQ